MPATETSVSTGITQGALAYCRIHGGISHIGAQDAMQTDQNEKNREQCASFLMDRLL